MIQDYNQNNHVVCDSDEDLNVYLSLSDSQLGQNTLISGVHNRLRDSSSRMIDILINFLQKQKLLFGETVYFVVFFIVFIFTWTILYLFFSYLNNFGAAASFFISVNLIALPLLGLKFQKKQKMSALKEQTRSNQFKVLAHCQFIHNLNEFLFILSNFQVRNQWQPFLQSVEISEGANKLNFYNGDRKWTECISQVIYQENKTIFVVEYLSNQPNKISSIFEINLSHANEHGFFIKFYTRTNKLILHKIVTSSSPILLKSLQSYIFQLKRDPKSILFIYYDQNPLYFQQAPEKKDIPQISQSNLSESALQQVKESPVQQQKSQEQEALPRNKQVSIQSNKTDTQNLKSVDGQEGNKDPKVKEYEEIIQKAKLRLVQLAELTPQNRWEEKEKKTEYSIHMKTDEQGNIYSRGQAQIKQNFVLLSKYLKSLDYKSKYDEMFKKGEVIKQITDSINVQYNRFNGKFPVGDRDFGILGGVLVEDEQAFLIGISIKEDDPLNPKVGQGCTRGELKIGGWILKKIDEMHTDAIYLVCSDPKGSIPDVIKNYAANKQALAPYKVRKIMEKN